MAYPIARYIIPPLAKLWTKKVTGMENVPTDKAFIIAANHASYFDHFLIQSNICIYLNKKLHYLAKKEHFDKGWEAAWHRWAGAIPIDRQAGGKEALREAFKILEKGNIIGMYPEGTRNPEGKLQRGKSGIARLALSAKVPVLPVGLINTHKVLPKGKIIPRFHRASMNVGKLMYFEDYYGKEDDHETLRKVTKMIMQEIARLSGQTYDFD